MKTLVIIPCYNEEESIVRTVTSLTEYIKSQSKYQIDYIVINDGSTDNSKFVLEKNGIKHINHVVNLGLGASIKTGILYSEFHNYDNITQFDGDGQHNPKYITNLIDCIVDGYDIVIGSRFYGQKKHWSFRMLGSKVLSNLIYLKTNRKIKISDPTSGQRMLSRSVKSSVVFQEDCSEPNFVVKYYHKGFTVKEIKVEMNDRLDGESHFNIYNSVMYMIEQSISIIFGY